MNAFSRLYRLSHISFILIKYGLDEVVLETRLLPSFKFLRFFCLSRIFGKKLEPRGDRIRKALEELGPIFVKFGQLLSARLDMLPSDIIVELSKLQDQVPPFCGKQAKNIVEAAFQRSLSDIFQDFEEKPLASASIAQVHAAKLLDGREIVVKVLRPNIHQLIKQDIEVLKYIAKLSERFWKASRQFKPKEIVAEFERALTDELDLLREAANASQLRRNFARSNQFYVPEIYWEHCKHNILVQERIRGIPIYQIDLLKQEGFDLKQLAELGLEIFFTQVFRDCYFHADMHPGNLFVSTVNPKQPQYIAVDFGIMGSLSAKDQRYLAENFLAIFNRDYRRVAILHQESGWINSNVRIDEFEANIRLVCEPIFEKPLKDISFATLLLGLFETARRFQINIQPQLILLQKTLFNIEGLGRRLYPDLDLWRTAKPFLENWMESQMGIPALIQKVKRLAPYWLERLPEIPELILRTIENAGQHSSVHSKSSFEVRQAASSHGMPIGNDSRLVSKISIRDLCFGMIIGIGLVFLFSFMKNY